MATYSSHRLIMENWKLTVSAVSVSAVSHLCRGVYSFCLSVRMFVRLFVCSFVLPSVAWNLRQSFALKFLKWCISQQLLIRKHSYLYPRHLCRGVYSFRFSDRPFVCSYVRLFVRSFVRSYFLPSRGICVKVLR